MISDELNRLLTLRVAFIDDHKVHSRKRSARLKRLRAAYLDSLMRPIAPMAGLQYAVIDRILLQAQTGLITQNDSVENHRRAVALSLGRFHQVNRQLRFTESARPVTND